MTQKNILQIVTLIIFATFLSNCTKKTVSQKGDSSFKDDLSAYRPQYKTAEKTDNSSPKSSTGQQNSTKPTHDITARLDTALQAIAVQNKNLRYAQGYRIQIYSGNNRDEANKARDRSYALFPDITPHFVYNQPTFRVKVGDFIDRLEAQRVYAGLITEFPNAMVVQDRIEIK
ncbi:SPOR domain-containing protein [Rhodocytophaga rosea]|uniref:SPOR domain-containing protein n=1 Tax=Rhodocytophaga rosea TaxID=2704465 RepID=A0A6C0GDZ9_9BACT|nr:SPOR domain-containing protein [Rhodocytophaga rosea]QHT66013.1 SPOR domain-containing protein [Rhodocytophaga rosea]